MMASVNNILIKDSFMYVVKSLFPNRDQLFLTKEKIESTCGITPGYYWTDDEIIKAWKEKQKISMFKQQEKQRWNRVMRIQVIKLFSKELSKTAEAQSDVIKIGNKTKPCYKLKPKSKYPKPKRRPKKPRGRKTKDENEHSSDKDTRFSHSRQDEKDNSGKISKVEFVDELIDGCPSRQEKKEIANEAKPCDTLMPTPSDGPESRSSKPERRTQTPQGGKRRDEELSLEKENKSSLESHIRQAEEDNSGKNSEEVEFVYKFIDGCLSRQEETESGNEAKPCNTLMPTPSDGPKSRRSETQAPQERKRRVEAEFAPEKKSTNFSESQNQQVEKKNTSVNSSAIYIKIPFSQMLGSKFTSEIIAPTKGPTYKFIDGCPLENEIRSKKTYVLSYNKDTKNADWVYEILNSETVKDNAVTVTLERFVNVDRYDQGHLAAAANHKWCQEAYNETFVFSNLVPQISGINKGMWRSLEEACRHKVKDSWIRNIHVYTGPIYLDKQRSNGSAKAVPDSLFKVIIEEHKDGTVSKPECYLIPNYSLDTVKKTKKPVVKDTKDKDTDDSEDVEDPKDLDYTEPSKGPSYAPYNVNIEEIENKSNLKFKSTDVQHYKNMNGKVMWEGEDIKGEIISVTVEVSIAIP